MKKLIAAILLVVLSFSLASCGDDGVMSYSEYNAAELDANVVVEVYVQATQAWWDNKITVYAADEDGAYFIYEMACSEADAAKLTKGTKIKVTGVKGAWAGEVEIMNATFEFAGKDTYTSTAKDLTAELGKDSLINYQNQLAAFKGLTVVEYDDEGNAFAYQDGDGGDLYFKAEVNGVTVEFCVEQYLTAPGSDVYTAVEALEVGDTIDVEAFLYWYNGANPHVTGITVK